MPCCKRKQLRQHRKLSGRINRSGGDVASVVVSDELNVVVASVGQINTWQSPRVANVAQGGIDEN